MLKLVTFILSVVALALSGCQSTNTSPPGQVNIVIQPFYDLQVNPSDFRISVDRRYVGNYDGDGVVLALPAGTHTIQVHSKRANQRIDLPNGTALAKTFTLKGEQRVEVLASGSKQVVVFDNESIKRTEVEDEDGHDSPTPPSPSR